MSNIEKTTVSPRLHHQTVRNRSELLHTRAFTPSLTLTGSSPTRTYLSYEAQDVTRVDSLEAALLNAVCIALRIILPNQPIPPTLGTILMAGSFRPVITTVKLLVLDSDFSAVEILQSYRRYDPQSRT